LSAAPARSNGQATLSTANDQISARSRRLRPVTTGTAILRYPLLFLVIVMVCAGLGTVMALARTPTQTAEVRLLIGAVDAEARAVPGFTQATQDLASIYARVAPTDVVLRPAAKAAGVSLASARGAVSASPIPSSSIVRIEVTGHDAARAVRLAGAAGRALSQYVATLNQVDPYSTAEYKKYAAAADALAQAQVAQQALQEQVNQLHTSGSPAQLAAGYGLVVIATQAEASLVAATSATLQAKLRADQLGAAFQNRTRGLGDTTPARIIGPAASQGDDRTQKLELGLLLGLVGGVLLALAVVVLRANWRYLRQLRRDARVEPRAEAA
jgi:capsular polysaccharide biosynthesis protein